VMGIRSNRLVSILDYGETVEGEACVLMRKRGNGNGGRS